MNSLPLSFQLVSCCYLFSYATLQRKPLPTSPAHCGAKLVPGLFHALQKPFCFTYINFTYSIEKRLFRVMQVFVQAKGPGVPVIPPAPFRKPPFLK